MQHRNDILRAGTTADDNEEVIISKKLADAIRYKCEFAFMGMESDPTNETPYVICDGGATSTLSSSFENCIDCRPKQVKINLAEGGVAMVTTHEAMKTYYFRTRTGEIRGVTTKTYITPGLRHDLLSVKALNRQGYCVIQHPDHEESGIYPIIEGKIDKSKSFAFMSEHSNLFCLKPEMLTQQQFDKMSGYEKWHRRLAHVSNRDIQQSIKHTTGLEELINKTYEQHTKCGACMIGKSTLEDYPALKVRADKPLKQINVDSFSSSVPSIEGYNHAAIFVDCNSGFRWIYGMKSKDDMLKITKKWYSDIAELRQKYSLVVFMRDNAGENKSQEIIDFIESIGATNRFSTSYEQWQNGLAESAINSIMRLARTVMAESGLGGRFWFKAASAGVDARNVTYKHRLGETPWTRVYGSPKDVSRFRAFGCRAYVHLNSDRREKGKHTARALMAVYLGFEPNTSAWSFYIPERQTLWSTNQAQFDEHSFPFRKTSIIDKFREDSATDILYQAATAVKWIPYNKLHTSNYSRVHYNPASDLMVLQVNTEENTFVQVTQTQFNIDMLDQLKAATEEQYANMASVDHRKLEGLDPAINPDRPPKNYKDAMSRSDRQEWAAAMNKEYLGFKDMKALAVVKPPKGAKILGTLTRWEYKAENGKLVKYKVRMTVRGDQQIEGESFDPSDLYAPVLKAYEARLLLAIAAAEGCPVWKTDTSQAFLYGSMGNDVVYIRPPDWWPEPIPEGHCLQLLKSIYGTRQAARRWHLFISEWMEKNGYPAVNSEKTIFMKREGNDFILHGLFVDDMMHTSTSASLKKEFMMKYSKDFNITGGGLMESFLGMQVEQKDNTIKLHLDHYVQEMLTEYKDYIKRSLRIKRVPMNPGLVLHPEDCPAVPDPHRQKFYRSFVAKLQFAATWIRFDIAYPVSQLARFCAAAGSSQWAALHHLMEYLEGFSSLQLTYRRRTGASIDLLTGYADADWGNSSSRRSTSGNLMLYNKSPIMWRSKMQKTTALSTAEAEYYSASTAGVDVLYLRNLLERLGFAQGNPTQVFEDNTACIEWGNNVIGGRERAKHIDIRKHFAHEVIQNGKMRLVQVATALQLADIFTKPLHYPQWKACVEGILRCVIVNS